MGVAAQVVRVLSREPENRPRDPMPAHCCHAVNHVVIGIGMPRAVNLGIRLVWSGNERKNGERTSLIRHEETVPVRDVFLSINPARVPVGPLRRIPMRLHERPGTVIRARD